jgi:hypothetical protein
VELIGAFISVLGIGVVATGAAAVFAIAARSGSGRFARWMEAAQACSVTGIQKHEEFFRSFVTGERGRHGLRIDRYKESKTSHGTRVTVSGLAQGIGLSREGLGTKVEKAFGTREHVLGDPAFDQALYVLGPEPHVRALLDAPTRQLLLDVFTGYVRQGEGRTVTVSASVGNGELRVEFPDAWDATTEPQADFLEAMLTLAERLAPVEDLVGRLAEVAYADPLAILRGHALAVMAREWPQHESTRQSMTNALGDLHPEVRLHAALELGEAGRPALRKLALAPDVLDVYSARAIDGLGPHLPLGDARAALEASLPAERLLTAQAAARTLGRGDDRDVAAVAALLGDPRATLAVTAAQALGRATAPSAESALLGALAESREEVVAAVAEALGHVGTARAVLPLQELEQRSRWGGHKVAREAVVRIQERLTGATPGQLAIAEGGAGQVSLSDDARGRVGLPGDST